MGNAMRQHRAETPTEALSRALVEALSLCHEQGDAEIGDHILAALRTLHEREGSDVQTTSDTTDGAL